VAYSVCDHSGLISAEIEAKELLVNGFLESPQRLIEVLQRQVLKLATQFLNR
jgi:hypothetical protein